MRKELYDMRIRSLVIFLIMTALFFILAPMQKLTVEILEKYTGNGRFLPENMIEKLKDWNFFIFSQWFGKNFGQFLPIIAVIMGFPLFAREYETGTIEYLLARRTRKRIFCDKFFSSVVVLLTILLVLSLLPGLYSLFTGKELNWKILLRYTVRSVISGFLWLSVAIFFSTIMNDQVKPLLSSFSLLTVTTVAGLWKPLSFLNTYGYILGSDILKGTFERGIYGIWYAAAGFLLILASYRIFQEKEF